MGVESRPETLRAPRSLCALLMHPVLNSVLVDPTLLALEILLPLGCEQGHQCTLLTRLGEMQL